MNFIDIFLWLTDDARGVGAIIIFVLLLSSFLGWIATIVKMRADIVGLKNEMTDRVGESVNRLHDADDTYNNNTRRCGELAKDLIAALQKGDSPELARDKLCVCFEHEVIRSFIQLFTVWRLRLVSEDCPVELYEEANKDSLAEFKRFKCWLQLINNEKFTSDDLVNPLKPLELREIKFRRYLHELRLFPESIRNECGRAANAVINDLVNN